MKILCYKTWIIKYLFYNKKYNHFDYNFLIRLFRRIMIDNWIFILIFNHRSDWIFCENDRIRGNLFKEEKRTNFFYFYPISKNISKKTITNNKGNNEGRNFSIRIIIFRPYFQPYDVIFL